MANELQVIVQQEPGIIKWNFQQLKESLEKIMSSYENTIYTDKSITTARQDLATLRKLKTAVEDKRKEIRRKCLEPYGIIEDQAKQLTTLIDKPIAAIDGQVKAYEEARKKEKRDTIISYMTEKFSDIPPTIAKCLQWKVYTASWENATTAKKVWVDAINAAHDQTVNELAIIGGVDEDFRDMAMEAYSTELVLADALKKVNELQKQREIIRQREQERMEAETRRQEELEKLRQEREAAALRTAQEQPKAERMPEIQKPELVKEEQEAPEPEQTVAQVQQAQTATARGSTVEKVLRIKGNANQISRILGFIKYAGATYEEVR